MTTITKMDDLIWRVYRVAGDHRMCIAAFFTRFDAEMFYNDYIKALGLDNKYSLELCNDKH